MDDHTDIVEYLRRNAAFNYKDTYIAAADEIERLRKELCECENLLDEYRRVEMDRDRWDYLREDTNE